MTILLYNCVHLNTILDETETKHTVAIAISCPDEFYSLPTIWTSKTFTVYSIISNTPFWLVITDKFNFKRVLVYTCSLFFYILRFSWSSGLMSYTRLRSLSITLSLFWFTLSLTCWSRTVVCSSILAWKSSLEPMCYIQTKRYFHECQLHSYIAITVKLRKLWTPEKFHECWLCSD